MPPSIRDLLSTKLNLLPQGIYDAFPAVLLGRMLVIANRVGMFGLMDGGAKTANEIASSCSFDPHATELALNLLVSGGYLLEANGNYTLTQQSRKWLLPGSSHYIGNFLKYIELLHEHWSTLEETLKKGGPAKTYTELFGEKEWKIYLDGMSDLARLVIPFVSTKLKAPRGGTRLLDIGGSHGLYAAEFCKRSSQLQAVILDFPEALLHTRKLPHIVELNDRISYQPEDLRTADFGTTQYDVILAFNIVHGFNTEENKKLFQKISRALKSGGVVYVLDQFTAAVRNSGGAASLIPAAVGLNLINEIGGSVFSIEQVEQWFGENGLYNVNSHRLRLPGVSLMSAVK